MATRNAILTRLRLAKARLGDGGSLARLLISPVEVCEFLLSHGVREVISRSKARLQVGRQDAISSRHQPIPPLNRSIGVRLLAIPPAKGTPEATFVISETGETLLTDHAMAAIVTNAVPGTYEVILIAAAGEPESSRPLSNATGLAANVVNCAPLSAEALNAAASRARGSFVIFLESQSELFGDWPAALLDFLKRRPDAGAVGPMVVDEESRVLSAGSIAGVDGSVVEYGHGLHRTTPGVTFVREVDACALPGLTVRRDAFNSIRGFASEYPPNELGRVDLAFRMREAGYRTWYQPAATVVWRAAESRQWIATGGGSRRDAFRLRHGTALSQRHLSGDARGRQDGRVGMTVVVVDGKLPRPDRDSGSVRLTAILRMLTEIGHRVTMVAETPAESEHDRFRLQQLGVEVRDGAEAASYLKREADRFDVVILCRMATAAAGLEQLKDSARRPIVIFDTVDLHFVREERQADVERNSTLRTAAVRTRAIELGLMRSSDRVWVTSSFEADLLRPIPGLPPIDLVPNVHEVRDDVPAFAGRASILFVGGFLHPPNEDAVLFFVRDIFPRVRALLPAVQFLIVGSDMPRRIRRLHGNGVTVCGHVPDLTPLFDGCRVSVAPLRYGAGVKGKVTGSLAQGLPVVATSIAAEGLDLRSREHLIVADDPATFAQGLIDLYTDEALWNRLSAAGRHHIKARLGYDSVKESVESQFAELARRRRP